MRRPVNLIFAILLLATCSGCFWGVEREGYDDRDHGRYGEHDRGEHGDRDRGEHEGRY